jgi:transcriptional regulator with XRE-family HTH domain
MNRRSPRWTAEELAEAAGISRQTISGILNERADSRGTTWQKLAAALGVDPPVFEVAKRHTRVSEDAQTYSVTDDPVESAGWVWDDDEELEERVRTMLRNVDRTVRGMVSDSASMRDVRLAACRGLIRQCEIAGKPVPKVLQQIYNEVIEGRFK